MKSPERPSGSELAEARESAIRETELARQKFVNEVKLEGSSIRAMARAMMADLGESPERLHSIPDDEFMSADDFAPYYIDPDIER